MALVLDWKKKLGYTKDPFVLEILSPAQRYIVGIEDIQEKFNLFLIKGEQFGTITGDPGMGKTTFLLWIAEALRGKHKPHYVNAANHGKQAKLLDALLQDNIGFFSKKFGSALKKNPEEKYNLLIKKLQKKQHALLIDNASNLSKEALQLIAGIVSKTSTHVLFSDTKDKIKKLTIEDHLSDKLKLRIPSYEKETLTLMLKKRIEDAGSVGIFPFETKELNNLIKKTDYNPARLLAMARDRAIELSLRVTDLPKPPVIQKSEKPGGKLFSIQIEKEEPEEGFPEFMETNKEEPKELKPEELPEKLEDDPDEGVQATLSEEEAKDAALLETVIQSSSEEEVVVVEEKPEPKKRKTKHDKAVEEFAEKFKKPKKKAVKKTKKKKR